MTNAWEHVSGGGDTEVKEGCERRTGWVAGDEWCVVCGGDGCKGPALHGMYFLLGKSAE